ncbi:MAG: MerR family transcriptional regulator [Polyangiaceae bacterium]
MSALARLAGVPAATIKHYLREGLLPKPAARTGRTMAWYDASLVPRIQAIKEIQRTRFLPLRLIKQVLDERSGDGHAATREAIERTLARQAPPEQRTRAELVAAGVDARDLTWLEGLGVVAPRGRGDAAVYAGDDIALLQTLGAARRAGLRPDMLPITILAPYVDAIRNLVRVELQMFAEGVLPRADGDVGPLTEAAAVLSERLVVLLRRRMLLPQLDDLMAARTQAQAASETKTKAKARGGGRRRAAAPTGAVRAATRRKGR